jgi:hypothetical protein
MTIEFLQSPDLWFWIFFTGSIVAMIWYYLSLKFNKKFRILTFLRVIVVLILLLGILHPKITQIYTQEFPKKLSVFIDNSMSMGFHKDYSLTRLNAELELFFNQLDEKKINYEVNYFDQHILPVSQKLPLNATGAATNIGGIIEDATKENQEDFQGYLIISDGQNTVGLDPKYSIDGVSIPIYTLGVGHQSSRVDISIKSIDAPTVAIRNEDIEITGIIESVGEVNKKITASLFNGNKLLGSKFIRVFGGGSQSNVRFRFKPDQLGESIYTLKLSSLEDELNIENNHQSFNITILQDNYKIALLTGGPSFNTSVIKQVLKQMPRISTDHFVQKQNEFYPPLKSFWEQKYELIILDNFPVSKMSNSWYSFFKKKISSQKSSIVFLTGPGLQQNYYSKIFSIFNVSNPKWSRDDIPMDWSVTERGEKMLRSFSSHPNFDLTQLELPPLHSSIIFDIQNSWMSPLIEVKKESNVLLFAGEKKGVRLAIWTPNNLHSLHYDLTATKSENLSSLVFSGLFSWLLRTGGNESLHFRLNKTNFQQGEEIQVIGVRHSESFTGGSAFFHVYLNDKLENSSELRYNPVLKRWEGSYWASSPGTNQFVIKYTDLSGSYEQKGKFFVEESQVELNNVFLNDGLLKNLSNKTGGEFYPWELKDSLMTQLNQENFMTKETKKFRPFESGWIAIIIISLLSLEWGIRRKFGFL